jgi:hypothetical protein
MCDGYDQANSEIAADVLRLEISRARDAYEAALKAYGETSGGPWCKWSEDLARAEHHYDTLTYALNVLNGSYLDDDSR